MHHRLSTLLKPSTNSGSGGQNVDLGDTSNVGDDAESKTSTGKAPLKPDTPQLAPPSLKVKHVDYYYSSWSRGWKYRNTSAKAVVEAVPASASTGKDDVWKDFLFVIVRTIPKQECNEVTVKLVVKSPYILKACEDVIQSWPGVSWNSDPLEIDPEIFLVFYDRFIEYRDALQSKKNPTQEETYVTQSLSVLISTLQNDYKSTLASLNHLTSHGEVTWELLPYILVPRSIVVARCVVTGSPRLFKLRQWAKACIDGRSVLQLTLESVDMVDLSVSQSVTVGTVESVVSVGFVGGVVKIQSLNVYPVKFFVGEGGVGEAELKRMAIERGKKWFGFYGVHHVQYDGVAALRSCGMLRHHVKGRIVIDRATFRRSNLNYYYPTPVPRVVDIGPGGGANDRWKDAPRAKRLRRSRSSHSDSAAPANHVLSNDVILESDKGPYENISMEDYTEEDFLLASTIVYGFSLSDKMWLEFSVSLVTPIDWNASAFPNLVLPSGRKDLLKSLIETHHNQLNFDDFIRGKGHGLVINLFGPPGVGKTFSAEATSEHVKRPLYVVGAGDLGTNAASLDGALSKVFELATAWKAIVLIDEADVFLEQRSLHDLQRNAMVAVFLRHVEYYRGILFLTTNRVKTFDEAFLSRIHVALHFTELSMESKIQVWRAFLLKVGALGGEIESEGGITQDGVNELARRDVNGRQIKNAVRTAQSLAAAKGEKLGCEHILRALGAMEEFTREFEKTNP